jgi:hypothetical protein
VVVVVVVVVVVIVVVVVVVVAALDLKPWRRLPRRHLPPRNQSIDVRWPRAGRSLVAAAGNERCAGRGQREGSAQLTLIADDQAQREPSPQPSLGISAEGEKTR